MTVIGELPALQSSALPSTRHVSFNLARTRSDAAHTTNTRNTQHPHTHVHTHVIRVVRNDYIIRVIRNYKIIRFIRIDAIIWIYSLLQLSGLIVGAQQDQWATSAYIVTSAGSLTLQPVVSTNRSL